MTLTSSLKVQSQEGTVLYKVSSSFEMANEKLNNLEVSEEVKKKVLNTFKSTSDFEFLLKFNQNHSLCNAKENLRNDGTNPLNITKISGGFLDIVFFDSRTRKTLIEKSIMPDVLIEVEPFDWQIEDAVKTILGKTCHKAVALVKGENSSGKFTKKIEAWFDPAFPVPYGPYIYNGLPGLILEVNTGDLTYQATKLEFKSNSNIKIKRPKGKIISQREAKERILNNYLFIQEN